MYSLLLHVRNIASFGNQILKDRSIDECTRIVRDRMVMGVYTAGLFETIPISKLGLFSSLRRCSAVYSGLIAFVFWEASQYLVGNVVEALTKLAWLGARSCKAVERKSKDCVMRFIRAN